MPSLKSTTPRPKNALNAQEEKAVTHLAQARFHQSFNLPANPEHGRPSPIQVTYADVDYRVNKDDGPTVFFIAGMYGGRYLAAGVQDALAKKHRIRFISVDNFGKGGTANVALEWRVKGFIDIVSALLDHLGVEHVVFASHSAGTIYLFNCLLQLRERLNPRHSAIYFLAPWVHQSHTGSLAALNLVPDSIIGKSDKIIKFVNKNIAPSIMWSTGVVQAIKGTAPDARAAAAEPDPSSSETGAEVEDGLEFDAAVDYKPGESADGEFTKTVMKYLFSENTAGGADDASLCLKRAGASWGYMDDYGDALEKIVSHEGEFGSEQRLHVQTFYAESDGFSGETGRKWFDELWKQSSVRDSGIAFESEVVEGSNHDSIADPKFGVVDRLFAEVCRTWG